MPAAPGPVRVVGRYALHRPIASGGMATVYLGRLVGQVGFSRTVAIKALHAQYASNPEFVAMFLDEARVAARIRHPNVVPTLDVIAAEGETLLVMDYVHGESLGRLLGAAASRGQPIPVSVVVSILSGVLQGLNAAHEAKNERGVPLQIVHRDISPQNILVGDDGQARLINFGVARAVGRSHTTQQGQVKGKLAYMPPEQLRGQPVGPATDLYAAAIVLWEALTTRRLFRADNEAMMVSTILTSPIEPPSRVIAAEGKNYERAREVAPLDDVVVAGLSRATEGRWQTGRDFARALESRVLPATAAQVSDWVKAAAGNVLGERAALVAELESNSAVDASVLQLGQTLRVAGATGPARGPEKSHEVAIGLAPGQQPEPATSLKETIRSDAPLPHAHALMSTVKMDGPPSAVRAAYPDLVPLGGTLMSARGAARDASSSAPETPVTASSPSIPAGPGSSGAGRVPPVHPAVYVAAGFFAVAVASSLVLFFRYAVHPSSTAATAGPPSADVLPARPSASAPAVPPPHGKAGR